MKEAPEIGYLMSECVLIREEVKKISEFMKVELDKIEVVGK